MKSLLENDYNLNTACKHRTTRARVQAWPIDLTPRASMLKKVFRQSMIVLRLMSNGNTIMKRFVERKTFRTENCHNHIAPRCCAGYDPIPSFSKLILTETYHQCQISLATEILARQNEGIGREAPSAWLIRAQAVPWRHMKSQGRSSPTA